MALKYFSTQCKLMLLNSLCGGGVMAVLLEAFERGLKKCLENDS